MWQLAILVMLQNMISLLLLVYLHWLPVIYRVNFKTAMVAHKGNAPEYLQDLIEWLRV